MNMNLNTIVCAKDNNTLDTNIRKQFIEKILMIMIINKIGGSHDNLND